ncbi:Hypothetical protein NTJ_00467 [Nesidiocoris tenuis]|uniref:Uncharacterized protein n=1 Tax=Nesidiocoris tenuis TaxID=355587 RepID=A0ABN7A9V4_9HEMI|nr:Hypothetical protein NTJ_00467 [Nesidiocoris tenuis]
MKLLPEPEAEYDYPVRPRDTPPRPVDSRLHPSSALTPEALAQRHLPDFPSPPRHTGTFHPHHFICPSPAVVELANLVYLGAVIKPIGDIIAHPIPSDMYG